MGAKLYVGNIPFTATETELRSVFEVHGPVESVNVITDRDTGRSRGFGFVEFKDEDAANAAKQALDGTEMAGRSLRVDSALDQGGGGRGSRRS